MISRRSALKTLSLTSGAVILAACGGGGGSSSAAPAAPTSNPDAPEVKLSISTKGSTAYYDNEKLEAAAGSKISLTLKNAADASSKQAFNWVLVKPGKMLIVVSAGQSEGADTDYVKAGDENVIAHTKLVQPGQSETITFDAPPAGEYPFICTFPGFYTTMKGTLTVR
jgi:azurin